MNNKLDVLSEPDVRQKNNSALVCMAFVMRQKGIKINMAELGQFFSHVPDINADEMQRGLQDIEVKSKWVSTKAKQLLTLPLPAIVQLQNGHYAVLVKVSGNEVLLQHYNAQRPELITVEQFYENCSGAVLLLVEDSVEVAQNQQEFGFKWFLKTIFKYRSVMREVLLASFFIQLFALVTPLFFMIIIDKVFSHNNLSTLNVLVFAMVVVSLFDVVLGGVRVYLMSHTTNRVDLELGSRLFKHMMKLPLSYFESRRSGETISRMREVETIRNFLTGSTLTLMIDILFLFVFLFVMYLFNSTLFLIVVVSLPLFFLSSYFITPLMRSKLEDKHQKMAENQSFLVETLGGIESIKSSAVETRYQREYEDKIASLSRSSFYGSNLSNLINQSTALISKSLTVLLLYVGANLVLAGELSVGQLIAFNMLSARVVQPIQRLANIWQEFTGIKVSIQRVADILRAPTEPMLMKGRTEMPSLKGDIHFEQVSFAYRADSPDVLTDIDLTIKAGEVVGIVGATGSGKTTLVKLLQRMYVPSKGKITIDGMNLLNMDGAQLRRQIGVVAQDFVLFNKSIRDNIILGAPDIDDQKVQEVAIAVGVHSMIMELADGYDTVLYERGRGLSTGQRQSIALVRALVTDPAILILDEATSALDYESEQIFKNNLASMCEGRTTFIIAHRLSTVADASRIVSFEDGNIIENDTPKELLKQGGKFAKLYEIHQSQWGDIAMEGDSDV